MERAEETEPLLMKKDGVVSTKCCGWSDRRPKCIEFALFWYLLAQSGSVSLVEQFVHSEIEGKYREVSPVLDLVNIKIRNNTEQQSEEAEGCGNTANNYTSPFASVIESSVQALSSTWLLYFDLALTLPAIFSTLIICSAGDKYGRKIGIMLVSSTSSIRILIYILAIYLDLGPSVYLMANAIEGLGGSSLTMFGSCLAYISDTSSVSSRTLRFIVIQTINTLAIALSSISIGFLISGLGFTVTFWLIAFIHCTNTIHIAVVVPDSHPSEIVDEPAPKSLPRRRSSLQALKDGTVSVTKRMFGSFSVFTQDYKNYSKLRLGLLLSAFLTHAIIAMGTSAVVTLYMLATPFCWNSVSIGIYNSISSFMLGAVGLIGVWILTKRFRDVTVVILGSISSVLNKLLFGLAVNSFMLYLAILVGAGGNVIFPLIRSMMSKIVGAKRQGALFAAVFCLETVCDLVSGVLMNAIYTATVAIYPGIVFFISAAVYFISTVFLCIYYYIERMCVKTSQSQTH